MKEKEFEKIIKELIEKEENENLKNIYSIILNLKDSSLEGTIYKIYIFKFLINIKDLKSIKRIYKFVSSIYINKVGK